MSGDRQHPDEPRLLSPARVLVLAAFALMAGVLAIGLVSRDPGAWFVPVSVVLFAVALGGGVGVLIESRRERRQFEQVDCSLRSARGATTELSDRWQIGVAVVRPQRICFRRTIGGVRFLPGRRVELVVRLVRPTQAVAGWRTALAVAPGSNIVLLDTSDGKVVEAAFPPGTVDQVLERLDLPEPT